MRWASSCYFTNLTAPYTNTHDVGINMNHYKLISANSGNRLDNSMSSPRVSVCNAGIQPLQPFNGLFSRTTWVSRHQKGKTNLDFTGARDSEWQWHQLGHMQVCTSLQTDNHASTPPLLFFTGRMPFLPSNQQRQSTEGTCVMLVYFS